MAEQHASTGSPWSTGTPTIGGPAAPQLRRVLGMPSLVLFGLVYMVPLTLFTTYGIVTQLTGGRLPLAYLVTLVVMLFTARSYGLMARAFPYAGSAYTYSQRSFGPGIGFMAGWALMLDYLFLPMINYLVIGIYLNAAFPTVPNWVFIVLAIAAVTVLNIVGIVSVSRTNTVIIAVQAIFIVVFVALAIVAINGAGPGEVDLTAPFVGTGDSEGFSPVLAGAAILCLSFLGFDSVSTLAEETREPQRALPRAITLVTVLAGILFVCLAYVSHVSYPSHAFADPDSAALDVMTSVGGQFLAVFFTAAYVAGASGSALASQASAARILFAMGRDGVLPRRVFGRLSARFRTPVTAILIVSVISLLSVVVDLGLLSETVSFGALVAFSAVNLSVIKHYFVDRGRRSGADSVRFLVLPLIGFGLTVWLWTSLSSTALTIGLIWLAVGMAWLVWLTRGFRRRTPMLDLSE